MKKSENREIALLKERSKELEESINKLIREFEKENGVRVQIMLNESASELKIGMIINLQRLKSS